MRIAVVGHVEWVEFARVERVPVAGEIVDAREGWEEAAGGGAVAAVQMAKLAGQATFFTALGDDERGHHAREELTAHGLRVEATMRKRPQRRALTLLDGDGERTITVLGERLVPSRADPLPWEELAEMDAVYFTGGDAAALEAARAARILLATPRAGGALSASGVALDVLVRSAGDAGEELDPESLPRPPGLVVMTHGAQGGSFVAGEGVTGAYRAAPLPGEVVDTYGAGDSFAGGLTFALGSGLEVSDALALAARCGAANLTGRGPYAGQLRAEQLST